MRVVAQRVLSASVRVAGEQVGGIGSGFLLLVGIAEGDGEAEVVAAVDKISGLRVFADDQGKMNRSIIDVEGEVLVVSQFTLLADVQRGRRPSFTAAAPPELAEPLIDRMVGLFREKGIVTGEGRFGAKMEVESINDGPVTLLLEFGGSTSG